MTDKLKKQVVEIFYTIERLTIESSPENAEFITTATEQGALSFKCTPKNSMIEGFPFSIYCDNLVIARKRYDLVISLLHRELTKDVESQVRLTQVRVNQLANKVVLYPVGSDGFDGNDNRLLGEHLDKLDKIMGLYYAITFKQSL